MLKLVIMLQVYFAIYDYFFLLSLAYIKKSLYLCSAKPTMGVCEWWGSCTRRCEQINIHRYIECPGTQASPPANNPDTIRASQGAEYIRWYKLGGQADMLKKAFVEALF